MRILVCGGRKFGYANEPKISTDEYRKRMDERYFILSTLESLAIEYSKYYNPDDNWLPSDIEIISGRATGADSVAADWAIVNWCKLHEYPANWSKYGRSAGFIRNAQMLSEGKPDLVVAFPGGKGTAHMIRLAKDVGIKVLEHNFPAAPTNRNPNAEFYV